MLTFWIRSAIAVLVWLFVAASTLSELGTLPPHPGDRPAHVTASRVLASRRAW